MDIIARDNNFNNKKILIQHEPDTWGNTKGNVNISNVDIPDENKDAVIIGDDINLDQLHDDTIIIGNTDARYRGIWMGSCDFNNSLHSYDDASTDYSVCIGNIQISDTQHDSPNDLIAIGGVNLYASEDTQHHEYSGVYIGNDIIVAGVSRGDNICVGNDIQIEAPNSVSNYQCTVIGNYMRIHNKYGTYIGYGMDTDDKFNPVSGVSADNSFVAVCETPYIGNEDYLFVIGSMSVPSEANAVTVFRNGAMRVYSTVSAPNFVQTSSIRYKENVEDISEDEAKKVLDLRPVSFDFKDERGKDKRGFIAEEVAQLFPNLVERDDEGRVESVDYVSMIPYLVKMVQSQQNEIEVLKCQIEKKN